MRRLFCLFGLALALAGMVTGYTRSSEYQDPGDELPASDPAHPTGIFVNALVGHGGDHGYLEEHEVGNDGHGNIVVPFRMRITNYNEGGGISEHEGIEFTATWQPHEYVDHDGPFGPNDGEDVPSMDPIDCTLVYTISPDDKTLTVTHIKIPRENLRRGGKLVFRRYVGAKDFTDTTVESWIYVSAPY